MASALLASRNEPFWGESRDYMRKYSSATVSANPLLKINPNPNPNPNSILRSVRQAHDSSSDAHFQQFEQVSLPAPVSYDLAKSMRNKEARESSQSYVTYNLGCCSRRELKELKKRLVSELQQVRAVVTRIESRELKLGSGYPESQFLENRPPSLQISRLAESSEATKRSPKANQNHHNLEFYTGKKMKKVEKMGMVKTETKPVTGIKRPNPPGSDVESKRPAMDPTNEKLVASMMKRCAQILTKLMKHKFGWIFNTPVDVVGLHLHDYYQIVKNPMDLGTVKSNLEKNLYSSPFDFASDVRLTFNNALLYNPKGSDVNILAENLLARFDEMFNPAYKKFEGERRRMVGNWAQNPAPESARKAQETMVVPKKLEKDRAQPAFSKQLPVKPQALAKPAAPAVAAPMVPTPVVNTSITPRGMKLPKPKAKDLNKRQMSFEEKAKLGYNLQNLPPEKMSALVQILKKRNGHLTRDGDEIELDIEAVDTETLWELDRFVCNYNKMASKIKRQALLQTHDSPAQNDHKPPANENETTPEPASLKSKKVDVGEEDVDIGEEIPMGNFPPVVIEKDVTACASSGSSSSSGGSSSSSGSSSSDSDSGSSSGSDSDKDSAQSPFVESKEAPFDESREAPAS